MRCSRHLSTLMKTQAVRVTRDGPRLVAARRLEHLALVFVLVGAVDALFWGGRALAQRFGATDLEAVALWGAYAILFAMALLPLGALWLLALGPVVVDGEQRTLRYRRRTYLFNALSAPRVETASLAGIPLLALVVDAGGLRVPIVESVPPEQAAQLDVVLDSVRELVGATAATTATTPRAAEPDDHLVAAILLAVGVVWAAAGYLAMPDFVLTHHGSDFGFLFWPLGLWIAAAGAVESAGLKVVRRLAGWPRLVQALAVAAWLAPYFLLCYRSA